MEKKSSPVGKVETAVEGHAVTLQPEVDLPRDRGGVFHSQNRPHVMGPAALSGGVNAAIVGSAPEVQGARGRALREGLGVSQAGVSPRAVTTTKGYHEGHATTTLDTSGGKSVRPLIEYA